MGALVPRPALAVEMGVCVRTIARWQMDEALNFPKPVLINGRQYFDREAIEDWKAERIRMTRTA